MHKVLLRIGIGAAILAGLWLAGFLIDLKTDKNNDEDDGHA